VVSKRGHTREIETEGGEVEVDDNHGEVNDDGLEVEDGSGMLEANGSMLWARGWRVMCLRSTAACSKSGRRWWCTLRSGSRRRRAPRPRLRQWYALGLRPRMTGSGSAAVSRATF
jgi:hypothetical protein